MHLSAIYLLLLPSRLFHALIHRDDDIEDNNDDKCDDKDDDDDEDAK